MRILGIDTSGPRAQAALMEGTELLASGELGIRGRTGERLPDLVHGLLGWIGWSLHHLDRMAVDVGPGSFTGLRVGLALAKGLSYASGVGIVPVSSLEALASVSPGGRPALAVLPAPRGMVYGVLLAPAGERFEAVLEEDCWEPARLLAELRARGLEARYPRINVLGAGASRLDLDASGNEPAGWLVWPQLWPSAAEVARLGGQEGREVWAREGLAPLVPRYLRGADVRQPRPEVPFLPRA